MLRPQAVHVALLQHAEGHTVHLGQAEEQQRVHPVPDQVQRLHAHGRAARHDALRQALRDCEVAHHEGSGVSLSDRGAWRVELVSVVVEPHSRPLRHQRPQVRVEEVFLENEQVRLALDGQLARAFVHTRAQLIQDALGGDGDGHVVPRRARRQLLPARVEHRVHEVHGELPAPGAEVQRHLGADGEVQLRLEGVQNEVHLVHQQAAAGGGPPHAHDVPQHVRLQLLAAGRAGVHEQLQFALHCRVAG